MPTWVYPFVFFASALLLVPVFFEVWVERSREERRRRTASILADLRHASATASASAPQGTEEKSAARPDRPLP